jgi:dihydroorotate dehydrogenase electron transfer subunit
VILQQICPVHDIQQYSKDIFILSFVAPAIARALRPGQFVNIKVDDGLSPLLRRPFSAHRIERDRIEVLFDVVGKGTAILSQKRPGDLLDVLGPLGVPFDLERQDFSTAILVAGGLGVAPFPLVSDFLRRGAKQVVTFLGGRSSSVIVDVHLENLLVATDDGSRGFHGNVVDLLKETMAKRAFILPRIFGCGPTPMLRALSAFALEHQIPAEVSLEGPMACGIGICQGCPVELTEGGYALMCKDGPVFDVRKILL